MHEYSHSRAQQGSGIASGKRLDQRFQPIRHLGIANSAASADAAESSYAIGQHGLGVQIARPFVIATRDNRYA
jgi:hypothetical protein